MAVLRSLPSSSSIGDDAPVSGITRSSRYYPPAASECRWEIPTTVRLAELRRARAALCSARSVFDSRRRYAHAHPESEPAWQALRAALHVLARAACELARLSHPAP